MIARWGVIAARSFQRGIAYAWASPWTLVGLCAGMVALASGGGVHVRSGVVEFYGLAISRLFARLPNGPTAMTLGHTVLGRTAAALDEAREHEMVHVRQYERWGPLFVPAYLLASLAARLRGEDIYRANRFEREAFGHSPLPLGEGPGVRAAPQDPRTNESS